MKVEKTTVEAVQIQRPILSTPMTIKPENILKQTKDGHSLVMVKRTRVKGKKILLELLHECPYYVLPNTSVLFLFYKGFCVECIKQKNDPMYRKNLGKIITHCPQCPGGSWICEPCFDRTHMNV